MPANELLSAITRLLEDTFHLTGWTIARAAEGQQKECYIARSDQRAVFFKLDGNTSAGVLRRLGELGVAPRVLGAGEIAGRPYVLQEYVSGDHPGWRWFADHLPLLAQVTRRYQHDDHLRELLTALPPVAYHMHLSAELTRLEAWLSSVLADPTHPATLGNTVRGAFADLASQADHLRAVPLAPAHPDPNGANIFLTHEKMLLVDWDDVLLSDPLRDVSQWLGWYVPRERWPIFFDAYGVPVDDALIAGVYWWSAHSSFVNVLWHLERGYEYEVFLRDTLAALQRQTAPHQVYREDV